MKRKRKDGRLTNFEVVKHKRDGRQMAIYLCRRCTRAWQLPRPCDPWRLKALIAHADAHNAAVGRALAEASAELETPRTEKEVNSKGKSFVPRSPSRVCSRNGKC